MHKFKEMLQSQYLWAWQLQNRATIKGSVSLIVAVVWWSKHGSFRNQDCFCDLEEHYTKITKTEINNKPLQWMLFILLLNTSLGDMLFNTNILYSLFVQFSLF